MTDDTSRVHAPRRDPSTPSAPLDLRRAAAELLEQARGLASRRSARTLTPGAGAQLKQSLLALISGQRLDDHPAPGPTTLQTVTGTVLVHHDGQTVELPEGSWEVCPAGPHALEATTDAVVLISVTPSDPRDPQG